MDTPPHSSPLIPTTVPQAQRRPTPPRVPRASVPLRVYNGPRPTAPRPLRLSPEGRARLDARVGLHLQAEQALGTLPYPHTCASSRRPGLAMAIVDEVMRRVPPGGALPTELRLYSVQTVRGEAAGDREDIAFNVAAWPPTSPPPSREVNPKPHPWAWYPHDPLGQGGTELELELAEVRFSGSFRS